ncbi:type 1 glutamine amidotransferase domain-containing protein [Paenibacillus sp. Z6-24]
MSKKVAVLVTNRVEDIELTSPVQHLEKAGHSVELLNADGPVEITGNHGGQFKIEKSFDEVTPEDYDALLVPGGFSPDLLRINPKNAEFAAHFIKEQKPVFSICHGPQFLIDTGLIKGYELTSFVSVRNDLKNAGAIVKDAEVIVDRNLVTSRTPDDLEAFNRESLKLLET